MPSLEKTNRLLKIVSYAGVNRLQAMEAISEKRVEFLERHLVLGGYDPRKAKALVKEAIDEFELSGTKLPEKQPSATINNSPMSFNPNSMTSKSLFEEKPKAEEAPAPQPVTIDPGPDPVTESEPKQPFSEPKSDQNIKDNTPDFLTDPNGWTLLALKAKKETGSIAGACKKLGITRTTWYHRFNKEKKGK